MSDAELTVKAEAVLSACRAAGLMLATAESCTGGMVAAALTDIAGSSDVVERGFVTYSNTAKAELLGVPPALIAAHGAVSAEVAAAMARGALAHAPVGLAVSITGIAGPGGATPGKPVGLVYFGIARQGGACSTERHVFTGDRAAVRYAAARRALELLHEATRGSI
ncbi:MAG: CinA family protein [Alphaproteobacteria bacterium]|nr:CinA family protein [Alphaproteobacteria bacterium]